jgi:peptidoglycan hydrolase-like protein with peptidoglycan-binding domain
MRIISSIKERRVREDSGTARAAVVGRNRALTVGIAAVVGSAAVSWGAASRIRSPAEEAARTAPPEPSAITAPVEKRVLSTEVVIRGTVRYGAPQNVILPISAAKKSGGLITVPPVKNKELKEGDVALTTSGRPVFVLQGQQPAYRDMGPGASGDDVRQLEEGLARLGFNPGAADGIFDGRTGAAVAAWYLRSGYTPFGPTEDQLLLLRAEATEMVQAQSEILVAEEAAATARHDVGLAQQKVLISRTPAQAAPLPGGPDAAARARAEQTRVSATTRVANKQRALQQAQQAERAAQARMEEARRRQPPPSQQEYAALSRDAREASNRVTQVQEELAAAQEALTALGDQTTTANTIDPSVIQQARVDAATADADVDKARAALAFAQRRLGLMQQKMTRFGTSAVKYGIAVPADEVLFLPTLPVRVDDAKLKAGDEVVGPVMTVTNSQLVIDSALSRDDAKLVRQGAPVALRAPDLGVDGTGTVTQVATTPGTNGVDPQRFYMEVTPHDVASSLLGASVVQTIAVESTEGEVLAVPVAAVSAGADGVTRVEVQGPNGELRPVTVTPGLSAKGMVAVTPVGGNLAPGDLVVVGRSGAHQQAGKPGARGR